MIRWIERVFWAAGFMLLGYCGASWLDSRLQQYEGGMILDRLLRNHSPAVASAHPLAHGQLVGRISVPRLGLSAIVFEGTDDAVLEHGVGHLPGSALPDQAGNVVLAGHRDSFFRDLRRIREGDVVTVTTEFGTRSYQVETEKVVSPTEVSVEAPTATPTLTLITCFPFNFIGHAPQRYIIRGEDVQVVASRGRTAPVEAAPAPEPEQTPAYVSYAIFQDSSSASDQ